MAVHFHQKGLVPNEARSAPEKVTYRDLDALLAVEPGFEDQRSVEAPLLERIGPDRIAGDDLESEFDDFGRPFDLGDRCRLAGIDDFGKDARAAAFGRGIGLHQGVGVVLDEVGQQWELLRLEGLDHRAESVGPVTDMIVESAYPVALGVVDRDLQRPAVGEWKVKVCATGAKVSVGIAKRQDLPSEQLGHLGLEARLDLAIEVEPDDADRVCRPDPDDGPRALQIGHDVLVPPAARLGSEELACVSVGEPVCRGVLAGSIVAARLGSRVIGRRAAGEPSEVGHLRQQGPDRDLAPDGQGETEREPTEKEALHGWNLPVGVPPLSVGGVEFRSLGSCPSGQWEQTVNLSADAFVGSNPTLPTRLGPRSSEVEHFFGKEEVTGSILVEGSIPSFPPSFLPDVCRMWA